MLQQFQRQIWIGFHQGLQFLQMLLLQLRPYTPGSTGSRSISEVKLVMAPSVLWWGTTREYGVLQFCFTFRLSFLFPLLFDILFFLLSSSFSVQILYIINSSCSSLSCFVCAFLGTFFLVFFHLSSWDNLEELSKRLPYSSCLIQDCICSICLVGILELDDAFWTCGLLWTKRPKFTIQRISTFLWANFIDWKLIII